MLIGVIRSILIMLVGFLLIFLNVDGTRLLIRVLGAGFFLPALVSMVTLCVSRAQGKKLARVLISTINVGCMAFGLWLMVAPVNFEGLFVKLLAVLLSLFAVYQIVMIVSGQMRGRVSAWLYMTPLLLVLASIFSFTVSWELATLSVAFGLLAVVAGISDLVIVLKLKRKSSSSEIAVVKNA